MWISYFVVAESQWHYCLIPTTYDLSSATEIHNRFALCILCFAPKRTIITDLSAHTFPYSIK